MIEENRSTNNHLDANKENNPSFTSNSRQNFTFDKHNGQGNNMNCSRNFNQGSGRQVDYYRHNNGYSNFSKNGNQQERVINSCSSFTDYQEINNTKPAYKMLEYNNLPSFKSDVKPGEVISKTQEDFKSNDWLDHFRAIDRKHG